MNTSLVRNHRYGKTIDWNGSRQQKRPSWQKTEKRQAEQINQTQLGDYVCIKPKLTLSLNSHLSNF